MMKLRDYQIRVVDELWDWFKTHQDLRLNPIVEACVSAGKSWMISAVCKRAIYEHPGTRILVVMHQKELASQNIDKFRKLWPGKEFGVWSAGLRAKKTLADVTFCTIGSVFRDATQLGHVDLILADECHLINPKEAGMWRRLIRELRQLGSPTRVVGFTGTPFRGNGVWLTAGDDALFTHVVGRVTMRELLDKGYLAPLIPAQAPLLIDGEGVGTTAGDYDLQELSARADIPDVVARACREIVALGAARRRWLVFAVDIQHANHVAAELRRLGVSAAAITEQTSAGDRDILIQAYHNGQLRCLVNVAVLTTGFDSPEIDFIALLRPTRSPVLYVQIAGRGMRLVGETIGESTLNGKADCLFADFTNTVRLLGPVDAVRGKNPQKRAKRDAPFKICDNCGSQCPTAAKLCPECGHEFMFDPQDPHGEHASGAALLSDQTGQPVSTIRDELVTHMAYRVSQKDEGRPYLLVQYFFGPRRIASETIHFELPGSARARAVNWWYQRTAMDNTPHVTAEALREIQYRKARGLVREPNRIQVDYGGKYPNIVHATFPDEQAIAARADSIASQRADVPAADQAQL